MANFEFQASREMAAPARIVYSVIADYHKGHPAILPKPPFIDRSGGWNRAATVRERWFVR